MTLSLTLLSLFLFSGSYSLAREKSVEKKKMVRPLVLGIHPYLPATELTRRFTPLVQEIEVRVKHPVRISIAKDYNEHIRRIGRDDLDMAYMGPVSYVKMVKEFGGKPLLARQELNGRPTFQGCIFIRKDSDIQSLKDLKGKRFAFGRPESTMSYMVPLFMLIKAGVQLNDLQAYSYLGSHNNVALSVLVGDFDAGAVKQAVFDRYEEKGLKLLTRTPAISEHLFVAGNKLDAALVEKIRKVLQGIKGEKKIESILGPLKKGTTGLVPVQDRDYNKLRTILETVAGQKGHIKDLGP